MKLKKLFWIGVLFLPLLACDEPDNIVETKARLELLFPITAHAIEGTGMNEYSFSGSTSFCLANKDNAKNCPDNITAVMPGNGSFLLLKGFSGENMVSELYLNWGHAPSGTENYTMQTPVPLTVTEADFSNNTLKLDLDEVLLPLIQDLNLNYNQYFKIKISGYADFNISSIAEIDIPLAVEHEGPDIRFTPF